MPLRISGAPSVMRQALSSISLPAKFPTFAKLVKACRNDNRTIQLLTTTVPPKLDGRFSPNGQMHIGSGTGGNIQLGSRTSRISEMLTSPTTGPSVRVTIPVAVKQFDRSTGPRDIAATLESSALEAIMNKPHRHVQIPLQVNDNFVVSKLARTDLANYRKSGPMPDKEFFKIMGQVGEGVQHLHGMGYLHLDLKFANILISHLGDAVVADVGGNRVETVREFGYLGRIIPEDNREVGTHSDVFGLAALVYEHFVDENLYERCQHEQGYFDKKLGAREIHNSLGAAFAASGVKNSPIVQNLIDTLAASLSVDTEQRPPLPALVSAVRAMEAQLSR